MLVGGAAHKKEHPIYGDPSDTLGDNFRFMFFRGEGGWVSGLGALSPTYPAIFYTRVCVSGETKGPVLIRAPWFIDGVVPYQETATTPLVNNLGAHTFDEQNHGHNAR